MYILNFHIVWTVILVFIFIGIVIWAYGKSSNGRFDAAQQLPFDDEEMDLKSTKESNGQKNNGEQV